MKERGHTYIHRTEESGAALFSRSVPGEMVMLNLLRFRETADYSEFPELASAEPISGRAAYERYIEHTAPFLQASGGSVLYAGNGGEFFIGPPGRGWDMVILVKQPSVEASIAFANNKEFLAGMGHRDAALSDSRLLPLVDAFS